MVRLFFISLLLCSISFAQDIERKIIVENGSYYYTTIHSENQLAVLHIGKVDAKVKDAERLIVPAGRHSDDPLIPFSWDLWKNELITVNFLQHPMNDRMEALKKFSLRMCEPYVDSMDFYSIIMKSTEMNPFANNEPYKYIRLETKILENFFFDGLQLNDSTYFHVVSNNKSISFWKCTKKTWSMGTEQLFDDTSYFTLIKQKKKLYLIHANGQIWNISFENGLMSEAGSRIPTDLKNVVLIEDRDNDQIFYIERSRFDTEMTIESLLKQRAIKLL